MLHTDIQITGDDFREAFKREQEALRVARDARHRELQRALQNEAEAFISEYRATFECARSEADGEADRHIETGHTIADRIVWDYDHFVSTSRKQDADLQARAAFYESALEAITEAMDDRERANLVAAAAHIEWFRTAGVDVPALAQARVAAMHERLAALKGAA